MRVKQLLLRLSGFTALWFIFWGGCCLSLTWAKEQFVEKGSVMKHSSAALELKGDGTTGFLTLKHAQSLALMHNPALKAFSKEVRALEAQALQAGLPPNPEIEIEGENFMGSGELSGTQSMETTIQLSQLIELGGKRSKRKQVASVEREIGAWDYETKRADVLAEVTKAFVDVLTAQERFALTKEFVRLAEQMLNTVSAKVRTGKVSPVEETRVRVVLASAQIDAKRAKRELQASRLQLATTWGSKAFTFEKAEGRFYVAPAIPSAQQIESLISQNPDINRWALETVHRQTNIELAEANGVPDVTVSVGGKHVNEIDDTGFVFGISIPIPFFDRNQGGVLEAQHRLAKAKEERRSIELRVTSDLAQAYESLSGAYIEVTTLEKDILPDAQSAFEAIREGYRQGKFDYLVMLDAQQTLFETKGQHIEALNQYHHAVSVVERLIGTSLDALTPGSYQ